SVVAVVLRGAAAAGVVSVVGRCDCSGGVRGSGEVMAAMVGLRG
nr:hypothetical protein [Tanacetum cinerariifolium]